MATPCLPIPDTFRTSYNDCDSYPTNSVLKTTYPLALKAYAVRLGKLQHRLFHKTQCSIPFYDFTGIGIDAGLQIKEVGNDAALKEWLGDQSSSTPVGGLATKADPKCRYIFLHAESSRKPLKITRPMLHRILTYHQVMPGYLEFLSVFGTNNEARDLRFSGFREQTTLRNAPSPRALEIDAMERSGRQYQLSYNLKAVACKNAPADFTKKDWSIRHGAFHHQFDVVKGTALWIVTQGHLFIKERVADMTSVAGRPEDRAFYLRKDCFRTTLSTNLLFCHWSMEEWRWYISWLEEVFDKETNPAIYNTVHGQYTPDHIQAIQYREDKVNEATMVLQANTTVITSLRDFYLRLVQNADFDLRVACADDVTAFAAQLDDLIYDSQMQIARAAVLLKIVADRKGLILQLIQSQATAKMEELTQLTIKIGTMSQREAIATRIITVVTLIYLPATFVSTFFSTDIVKYQGEGNGSFSAVAMFRWLQVSVPLTLITLAVGYIAYERAGKAADKEFDDALFPVTSAAVSEKSGMAALPRRLRKSKTWLSNLCV